MAPAYHYKAQQQPNVILIILSSLLALAACSSGSKTGQEQPNQPATEAPVTKPVPNKPNAHNVGNTSQAAGAQTPVVQFLAGFQTLNAMPASLEGVPAPASAIPANQVRQYIKGNMTSYNYSFKVNLGNGSTAFAYYYTYSDEYNQYTGLALNTINAEGQITGYVNHLQYQEAGSDEEGNEFNRAAYFTFNNGQLRTVYTDAAPFGSSATITTYQLTHGQFERSDEQEYSTPIPTASQRQVLAQQLQPFAQKQFTLLQFNRADSLLYRYHSTCVDGQEQLNFDLVAAGSAFQGSGFAVAQKYYPLLVLQFQEANPYYIASIEGNMAEGPAYLNVHAIEPNGQGTGFNNVTEAYSRYVLAKTNDGTGYTLTKINDGGPKYYADQQAGFPTDGTPCADN